MERIENARVHAINFAHRFQRVIQADAADVTVDAVDRNAPELDVRRLLFDPGRQRCVEVEAMRTGVGEKFQHLDLAVVFHRLRRAERYDRLLGEHGAGKQRGGCQGKKGNQARK